MRLFRPNVEKLKKAGDVSGLMRCLDHKNADVRYAAFSALASDTETLDEQMVSRLKGMLNDPSPKVRDLATLKFTDWGGATNAENLMEIIRDGSQGEKIELLRIIAWRAAEVDEILIRVIGVALADRKEMVKLEAIQTAGATGKEHFIPNLLECLHDNYHNVRIQAAKALYRIGGADSVDHLISLLVDRDPDVRMMARSYLASINTERSRRALHDDDFMQLVRGMNGAEYSRRETIMKIAEDKIREALPLLYKACQDEYKLVRLEALKAIAVFKDPASINVAARMLGDKYFDVRVEAVRTLSRIISRDSLKVLETALIEGDRHVREEAQRAVYHLKSRL